MIYIALCDDEQIWIDQTKALIYNWIGNRRDEIQLECFSKAQPLLDMILKRKEWIDILILDIDLPDLNGFEVARRLKTAYPDLLLLFFTAHAQYVFDSFQFQPFRYIRKEHVHKELCMALDAACETLHQRRTSSIVLKTEDLNRTVKVSEIMYFELEDRRCNVYLKDGNVLNVRKTIKGLISEINSTSFVQIHSGAAINIKYIKSFTNYTITLDNDIRLVVSRRHIKSVKGAIMTFWGNQI